MQNNTNQIIEVFNQFAVQIDGQNVLYNTRDEAQAALTAASQGAIFRETINDYLADRDLEGKNAKAKENIIYDFMLWQASKEEEVITTEV